MENKKINLNNISKRLNEITDYLIDLKKETARVVIKQIYYNCFFNKLKLEDMFEVLSEMREETNLRLQTELDKIIAKTSISNVLEILNEEIKTAVNVDITLIMYLITNEDIQVILEDDIPVLLNFTRTLYNMNTKYVWQKSKDIKEDYQIYNKYQYIMWPIALKNTLKLYILTLECFFVKNI